MYMHQRTKLSELHRSHCTQRHMGVRMAPDVCLTCHVRAQVPIGPAAIGFAVQLAVLDQEYAALAIGAFGRDRLMFTADNLPYDIEVDVHLPTTDFAVERFA